MALHRFQVVGAMPIRDALTKESVLPGGVVSLDDQPVPRGLALNGKPAKPLAATNIPALLEAGLIGPVEPASSEPAEASKKA